MTNQIQNCFRICWSYQPTKASGSANQDCQRPGKVFFYKKYFENISPFLILIKNIVNSVHRVFSRFVLPPRTNRLTFRSYIPPIRAPNGCCAWHEIFYNAYISVNVVFSHEYTQTIRCIFWISKVPHHF